MSIARASSRRRARVACALALLALARAACAVAPMFGPAPACPAADERRLQDLQHLAGYEGLAAERAIDCLRQRLDPHSRAWIDATWTAGILHFEHTDRPALAATVAEFEHATDGSARSTGILEHLRAALAVADADPSGADLRMTRARLALDEEADPWFRAQMLDTRMRIKLMLGDTAAMLQLARDRVAVADASGDAALQGFERLETATWLAIGGQGVPALELIARTRALVSGSADALLVATVDHASGVIKEMSQQDAGARVDFELAVKHARIAAQPGPLGTMLIDLADFYVKHGDAERGIVTAQEAVQLSRQLGDPLMIDAANTNLVLAEIHAHRKADYERDLPPLIEQDRQRGGPVLADGLYEFAAALRQSGDEAAALRLVHLQQPAMQAAKRAADLHWVAEDTAERDAAHRREEIALIAQDSSAKRDAIEAARVTRQLQAAWLGSAALIAAVALGFGGRLRQANRRLAASNALLEDQSQRDPLTGLANRRRFQSLLESAGRERRFTGGLLLLDIDHFKRVNDTLGHGAGDDVLAETARRVAATLRADDVAVRWGGEEMLAFLPQAGQEQLAAAAARLMEALARTGMRAGDAVVTVTASIGYAAFPLAGCDCAVPWRSAVALVDAAMYRAKAGGRHRAVGLHALRAADAGALEAIADDLAAAIADGRVETRQVPGPPPGEPA